MAQKLLFRKKRLVFLVLVLIFGLFLIFNFGFAQNNIICAVYITGIGCPHCAASDPVVLDEYTKEYPNFIVIEYEIYQESKSNASIFGDYIKNVGAGSGIPQIIIEDGMEVGERTKGGGPLTTWTKNKLETLKSAFCKLPDAREIKFEDLDINSLPGNPKIWANNRILIKTGRGGDSKLLKRLLVTRDISSELDGSEFEIIKPEPVLLSGIRFPQMGVLSKVNFDNAVKVGGWIFQWNGKGITKEEGKNLENKENKNKNKNKVKEEKILEENKKKTEIEIDKDKPEKNENLGTVVENIDRNKIDRNKLGNETTERNKTKRNSNNLIIYLGIIILITGIIFIIIFSSKKRKL